MSTWTHLQILEWGAFERLDDFSEIHLFRRASERVTAARAAFAAGQPRPPQPLEDLPSTRGLLTKFIRDEQVDALDINVDTYEGVVTLNGSVPSRRVEQRVVQIARSVKGVKGVTSKLVLVSP